MGAKPLGVAFDAPVPFGAIQDMVRVSVGGEFLQREGGVEDGFSEAAAAGAVARPQRGRAFPSEETPDGVEQGQVAQYPKRPERAVGRQEEIERQRQG